MTDKDLVEKYIKSTLQVFSQIEKKEKPHKQKTEVVLDYAKRYLEDAIYYSNQKKLQAALASVSYSEGLLDALKLLDLVEFDWPTKTR